MSKELYNMYSPWNQNDAEYGDDVYLSDGVYVTAEGEVYNTKVDTYYCKECDCILRWDESETVCKSCEERIKKETK